MGTAGPPWSPGMRGEQPATGWSRVAPGGVPAATVRCRPAAGETVPIAKTRPQPPQPAGAIPVHPPARRRSGSRVLIGLVVGLLVLVGAVVPGIAWAAGFTKADGGHVVVVRNGGLFDDNSI